MGFLDKAKKLADQAQAKLEDAQQQFNQSQSGGRAPAGGPAVEYDKHGRPVSRAPSDAPPEAPAAEAPAPSVPSPAAASPAAPAAPSPAAASPAAPAAPPPAAASPAAPAAAAPPGDRNMISYEPPKLTSGDPLAG